MLAHQYKVWSWGDEREDGQEDCVKYDIGITVVAKRNRYQVYEVFNELVSMQLGRILGLPIPVGLITTKNDNSYYCSANISPGASDFPPADIRHLALNKADLACGIAIFDSWICNADRHAKNIFYDTDDGTVFLIDHGQSLLNTIGISHLRHRESELQLHNQFASELINFSTFCEWYERLVRIPEYTIKNSCREASVVGVDLSEALSVSEWLIKRRSNLPALFRDNQHLFTNYQPSLFPPFGCDNDPVEYSI